jgi:hypothetical protein
MWGEAALRLERRMREGGHVSTVIKPEATTRTEGVPKTFGTAPLLLSGARGVPVEARETLEVRRSAAGALAQAGRRRRCGVGDLEGIGHAEATNRSTSLGRPRRTLRRINGG